MAGIQWKGGKLTSQKLGAMNVHFGQQERLEHEHSNPDIDKTKTPQNYCIGCRDFDDAKQSIKKRVKEIDKESPPLKSKGDKRIVAMSLIAYCPQEIVEQGKEDDFFQYLQDDVLEDFFGEDLHGQFVHKDEIHQYIDPKTHETKTSLPHSHIFVTPYAEWTEKDKKTGEIRARRGINGKNFSSPKRINQLNAAVDKMCRERFGVPYVTGEGKKNGKTAEQLKAESKIAALENEIANLTSKRDEEREIYEQAGRMVLAQQLEQIEDKWSEIAELDEQISDKQFENAKLNEQIADKRSELKDLDEQIVAAVEIPPRPQLPPPLPPDEPRPTREHRPYSREEEKALAKAQKQWDKDHSKGGKRWTEEQEHAAETARKVKEGQAWDERHQPLVAAKNVISKNASKERELAARERQIQQAQQQIQAELERGRAETERAKRAVQKREQELDVREQDMDVEVARKAQERLAQTDSYQRLMAISPDWERRMATLYNGADKRNEKAFEDKVKTMKKGQVER